MKVVIKADTEFRLYYSEVGGSLSFEDFVDEIVEVGHACSHLKGSNDFGIVPGQSDVYTRIEPLIPSLAHIARRTLGGT